MSPVGKKLALAASVSIAVALFALALDRSWNESDTRVAAVAGSFVSSQSVLDTSLVVPSLLSARQDLPVIYESGCHAAKEDLLPEGCRFGDPDSDTVVALIGDSHAANWLPALRLLAEERNWLLLVYTKSACPFVLQHVSLKGMPYEECLDWNSRLIRELPALSVDLVFTSQSTAVRMHESSGAGSHREVADALLATWRQLLRSTSWSPSRGP